MEKVQIIAEAVKLARKHTPHAKYAVFVDFSRKANEHRFFLVDVDNEEIDYSWFTSHGSGSGELPKAVRFSNTPNSLMSSKGLMKTGDTYNGKHGYSCRLIGLEPGTNDNVSKRAIVIHRSAYVSQPYMQENEYPGRSWGCITLDPEYADNVINKIKNGSIVYVYA